MVVSQFEVARASCPSKFMAKMTMPLQTETLPPIRAALPLSYVGLFLGAP